jgi:hypothetical protein
MAKKLKDVIDPKGYTPKAPAEQAFEKVHTLQTHEYRADIVGKRKGSSDEIFNAGNVKVSPRPGKSSAAGQQFSVSEEALDELSLDTVKSYKKPMSESDYHGEFPSPLTDSVSDKYYHRDQFMHHSQGAIDAKMKSNSSRHRAEVESDRAMKDHFTGLADHYHAASKHHLKMAALHAKKFQVAEDTEAEEMLQAVNEAADIEDLIDIEELTAPINKASAIEKKKTPQSGKSWNLTKTIKKAVKAVRKESVLDELTAPITKASKILKKKTPKSGLTWHLTKTLKKDQT